MLSCFYKQQLGTQLKKEKIHIQTIFFLVFVYIRKSENVHSCGFSQALLIAKIISFFLEKN